MWDYNVGLVRVTPFFKCCKYSKVGPPPEWAIAESSTDFCSLRRLRRRCSTVIRGFVKSLIASQVAHLLLKVRNFSHKQYMIKLRMFRLLASF